LRHGGSIAGTKAGSCCRRSPHGETYAKLGELEAAVKERGRDTEQATVSYLEQREAECAAKKRRGRKGSAEVPDSLEFLQR
jgi:hypothetical protein